MLFFPFIFKNKENLWARVLKIYLLTFLFVDKNMTRDPQEDCQHQLQLFTFMDEVNQFWSMNLIYAKGYLIGTCLLLIFQLAEAQMVYLLVTWRIELVTRARLSLYATH